MAINTYRSNPVSQTITSGNKNTCPSEDAVFDALALVGGATTFLALTDTPASYTGQTLKVVRVNAGETALEFVTLAGGGDMLSTNNLSDVSNVATARTNLGLDTTANQTDSTDKRFMSDAQESKLDSLTQYTDELAQDAVGAMVANSTFVSLAYVDGTPSLTPSLSATGTPSATTFLRGDNTWDTPASVDPEGWTTIVKSANQDVTNSITLVDDTDLQFSVVSGGYYMVEMNVCYSGNDTTGDYRFILELSTGLMRGTGHFITMSVANAITTTLITANNSLATSNIAIGVITSSLDHLQALTIYFNFYVDSNATFKYKFANSSAALGRISRTWKGSILKYKRID